MSDCQYTPQKDGTFKCSQCGDVKSFVSRRNCGGPSRMRGLGDAVAKVTSAVGIKPCSGCKRRRDKLNKLVPFHKK